MCWIVYIINNIYCNRYSFSPLIWHYSIDAEVFSLNNFFVIFIIYLTIKISLETSKDKKNQLINTGALFCGLSLTNQHTMLFNLIPLVLYILFISYKSSILNIDSIKSYAKNFFIGFSVYLYLPISTFFTNKNERFSWGNFNSLYGIVWHMLRIDYGTFQLSVGHTGDENVFMKIYIWFLNFTFIQTYVVGSVIMIIGIIIIITPLLMKKSKKEIKDKEVIDYSLYIGYILLITFSLYYYIILLFNVVIC